jgi:hypothetical protein
MLHEQINRLFSAGFIFSLATITYRINKHTFAILKHRIIVRTNRGRGNLQCKLTTGHYFDASLG